MKGLSMLKRLKSGAKEITPTMGFFTSVYALSKYYDAM